MNTRSLVSAFLRFDRFVPQPLLAALLMFGAQSEAVAQTPQMLDPKLEVRTVVSGLAVPTSMAFLDDDDFLVLEKATGRVLRVKDGAVHSTVLDLAVNSASERGLLGIALHKRFPRDPGVYLYWTESSTGADTNVLSEVPLLGNRVDRFVWKDGKLTWDHNVIRLRALQQDADQPERGNHDGGVLRFGPDGKLYIFVGDLGRRGQMQNLPDGPGPAGGMPDDQFGGPEPDNAHLSGVILRLNPDGSTPRDNPFYRAGERRGGEAGANLQKVFAFGIRNGFGLAFDPRSGELWDAQNGDDSFSELNRVIPGANLGWIQIMGPLERLSEFKAIETSEAFLGLQQVRWPPSNIADDPWSAVERLFKVYDGGNEFGAALTGEEEVPAVETDAMAVVSLKKIPGRSIEYRLRAAGPITAAMAAHIHLGAYNQNGAVVAFLFSSTTPRDFKKGDQIARGVIREEDLIARPGFEPTLDNLLERMRQGRTYVNLHTMAHPAGEIRGQLDVVDRDPVSTYNDPEFSWKYEVAPGALGFIHSRALGRNYQGNLILGAARPLLEGGHLFRFELTKSRKRVLVRDERLKDRVADNLAKYDITESESLLFGRGFGVSTDIQSGPNGNLYIVSLSAGAVYEIYRK